MFSINYFIAAQLDRELFCNKHSPGKMCNPLIHLHTIEQLFRAQVAANCLHNDSMMIPSEDDSKLLRMFHRFSREN
jgi:hypothetical protein